MTTEEKRDLITLLAERVMGWRAYEPKDAVVDTGESVYIALPHRDVEVRRGGYGMFVRWNPLENIADAWMLVESLRARGDGVVLTASGTSRDHIGCFFVDGVWAIARTVNALPDHGHPALKGSAFGETMPLAICLAAARAVAEEPK